MSRAPAKPAISGAGVPAVVVVVEGGVLIAVVVRAAGGAQGLGRGSLFSRPSWALVDVPVKTHTITVNR